MKQAGFLEDEGEMYTLQPLLLGLLTVYLLDKPRSLYVDMKPNALPAGCKGETGKGFHATNEILHTCCKGDEGILVLLFNA
jgi:hypothetical protein